MSASAASGAGVLGVSALILVSRRFSALGRPCRESEVWEASDWDLLLPSTGVIEFIARPPRAGGPPDRFRRRDNFLSSIVGDSGAGESRSVRGLISRSGLIGLGWRQVASCACFFFHGVDVPDCPITARLSWKRATGVEVDDAGRGCHGEGVEAAQAGMGCPY